MHRLRRGFTLIELLVVIAIIAILAGLLFPVFNNARNSGLKAACLSNLRQIGNGLILYAQDYDESLPKDAPSCMSILNRQDPCSRWNPEWRIEAKLAPYVKNTDVFRCSASRSKSYWNANVGVCDWNGIAYPDAFCVPQDPAQGRQMGYGWNQKIFNECIDEGPCGSPGVSLAEIVSVSNKVMAADSSYYSTEPGSVGFANYTKASATTAKNKRDYWPALAGLANTDPIDPGAHSRHFLGSNVLFLDGHAQWMHYGRFTGASWLTRLNEWFDYTRP